MNPRIFLTVVLFLLAACGLALLLVPGKESGEVETDHTDLSPGGKQSPAAPSAVSGAPLLPRSRPIAAQAQSGSPTPRNVDSLPVASSVSKVSSGQSQNSSTTVSSTDPSTARTSPAPAADPSWLPTGFVGIREPAEILAGRDLGDPVQRLQAVAEMAEVWEVRREGLLAEAARQGIPVRIEGPGNRVRELYAIREEGPLYRTTFNTNAAISTGANLVSAAPYNLRGSGMTAGVWDEARVRPTHVELSGRVTVRDGTGANSDHATHVAGTIAATGNNTSARGMAPLARIDSYDWNNDYTEMTSAGAATATDSTKLPLSNHSYGFQADTADMGRYESEARSVDAIAHAAPFYQIFWAAGNEQDELTSLGGYQSITFVGLAKNVLTIGAVNDAASGGVRNPAAGTLADFSSMGPCDDGRIKPDLVANGVNVFSSVATSNTAYDTYSGTSMATPNAVGTATLLVELYKTLFGNQIPRASLLKALLIHTADDVGRPGPDYQYGWGLINGKAAADLLLAHKNNADSKRLIEGTITNTSKSNAHLISWDGTSPLRATVVWTDPPGVAQTSADSRTRNLVHDLDLKITAPDGTTTFLPYVMPFTGNWTAASMTANATRGVNNVDNVERVDIASPPQAGTYTITVGMFGNNTLTANQTYSLVITGAADVPSNPPPVVELTNPQSGAAFLSGAPVALSANATDLNVSGGPGAVTKVEFLSGLTVLGEDATAPYSFNWTPPAPGVYQLTARATDNEAAVGVSPAVEIGVLAGDGRPVVSSFSPGSGEVGSYVEITGSNFYSVTGVGFQGANATLFTFPASDRIRVQVPVGTVTGPITIFNAFGNGTSAGNFVIEQNPVLISQIYGAGGNTGAVYNADYVELFNRGNSTVSLSGWSLQYASASGTTWSVAPLSGSIAPGKYFLIRLAGGSTGTALPTPDLTSTAINMSQTQGKIALRNTADPFTGATPVGQSGLRDFVGFGSANAFRTSPAPSPSATTAIFRAGGGATDTGDNGADFSAATPNPRNSSFGAGSAPVITSPLSATGTAGQAFTYQITATNSPTSFGAVGLPQGLGLNATTGLISGTPTIAGNSTVSISATNAFGSDSKSLALSILPASPVVGNYTVTFEDASKGEYAPGNVTLSGVLWNMTEVMIGGDVAERISGNKTARLRGYSNSTMTMLENRPGGIGTIELKHKRYGTDTQVEWIVEYSLNSGGNWTEAGRFTSNGSIQTFSSTVNQTGNYRLRIRTEATSTSSRRTNVDDIVVTGYVPTPTISLNGTLSALQAVYGSPSATPASFAVSGSNLAEGILVSAPAGFEVSQTTGGASGYASSQLVGGAGSVPETSIFVRLAGGIPADSYSGNIVCSSAGAATVTVPVPPSTVQRRPASVRANDRTKPFGQTLSLGTGQTGFSANGLAAGETIATVTLTASGGTGANDASGLYEITPSDASGGSFDPANYLLSYQPGTLRVTGIPFHDWSAGLGNGSHAGDSDKDQIPNLIEYFMALDAERPDAPPMTPPALTQSGLQFEYRRSKSLEGVSGRVVWKDDLTAPGPWSAEGVTDQRTQDAAGYEIRRATVPMPPGTRSRFIRIEVFED